MSGIIYKNNNIITAELEALKTYASYLNESFKAIVSGLGGNLALANIETIDHKHSLYLRIDPECIDKALSIEVNGGKIYLVTTMGTIDLTKFISCDNLDQIDSLINKIPSFAFKKLGEHYFASRTYNNKELHPFDITISSSAQNIPNFNEKLSKSILTLLKDPNAYVSNPNAYAKQNIFDKIYKISPLNHRTTIETAQQVFEPTCPTVARNVPSIKQEPKPEKVLSTMEMLLLKHKHGKLDSAGSIKPTLNNNISVSEALKTYSSNNSASPINNATISDTNPILPNNSNITKENQTNSTLVTSTSILHLNNISNNSASSIANATAIDAEPIVIHKNNITEEKDTYDYSKLLGLGIGGIIAIPGIFIYRTFFSSSTKNTATESETTDEVPLKEKTTPVTTNEETTSSSSVIDRGTDTGEETIPGSTSITDNSADTSHEKETEPTTAKEMYIYTNTNEVEIDVESDGNCFFHVVAKQLGNTHTHQTLREEAVKYARDHRDLFDAFRVEGTETLEFEGTTTAKETFDQYLERMKKSGTYADDLIIAATAKALKIKIEILNKANNLVTCFSPEIGTEAIATIKTTYLQGTTNMAPHYLSREAKQASPEKNYDTDYIPDDNVYDHLRDNNNNLHNHRDREIIDLTGRLENIEKSQQEILALLRQQKTSKETKLNDKSYNSPIDSSTETEDEAEEIPSPENLFTKHEKTIRNFVETHFKEYNGQEHLIDNMSAYLSRLTNPKDVSKKILEENFNSIFNKKDGILTSENFDKKIAEIRAARKQLDNKNANEKAKSSAKAALKAHAKSLQMTVKEVTELAKLESGKYAKHVSYLLCKKILAERNMELNIDDQYLAPSNADIIEEFIKSKFPNNNNAYKATLKEEILLKLPNEQRITTGQLEAAYNKDNIIDARKFGALIHQENVDLAKLKLTDAQFNEINAKENKYPSYIALKISQALISAAEATFSNTEKVIISNARVSDSSTKEASDLADRIGNFIIEYLPYELNSDPYFTAVDKMTYYLSTLPEDTQPSLKQLQDVGDSLKDAILKEKSFSSLINQNQEVIADRLGLPLPHAAALGKKDYPYAEYYALKISQKILADNKITLKLDSSFDIVESTTSASSTDVLYDLGYVNPAIESLANEYDHLVYHDTSSTVATPSIVRNILGGSGTVHRAVNNGGPQNTFELLIQDITIGTNDAIDSYFFPPKDKPLSLKASKFTESEAASQAQSTPHIPYMAQDVPTSAITGVIWTDMLEALPVFNYIAKNILKLNISSIPEVSIEYKTFCYSIGAVYAVVSVPTKYSPSSVIALVTMKVANYGAGLTLRENADKFGELPIVMTQVGSIILDSALSGVSPTKVAITLTVGGLQYYQSNNHAEHQHEKSSFETVMPYILDTAALAVSIFTMPMVNNYIEVGRSLIAMSSIVATTHYVSEAAAGIVCNWIDCSYSNDVDMKMVDLPEPLM